MQRLRNLLLASLLTLTAIQVVSQTKPGPTLPPVPVDSVTTTKPPVQMMLPVSSDPVLKPGPTLPPVPVDFPALILKRDTPFPTIPQIDDYPWRKATNEGLKFKISNGPTDIRFGAGEKFVTQTFQTGEVPCSVEAFGADPVPNVGKSCYMIIEPRLTQPPTCFPKTFGGTGTSMKLINDPLGKAVYYFCPGKFDWSPTILTCPTGLTCGPDYEAFLSDVISLGTQKAISNAWNKNVTMGLDDSQKHSDLFRKILPELKTNRPANPVYVTTVNGALPTRPVYPFTRFSNGVISGDDNGTRTGGAYAKAAGSIPVGSTCDCLAGRVMVGPVSYCVAPGNTAAPLTGTLFVASCSRK